MIEEDLWRFESRLIKKGFQYIAGVDEAGRGPLAGPVVAAAVILPPSHHCLDDFVTLRESKQLTPKRREFFYDLIQTMAVSIGVGMTGVKYIDHYNILEATKRAMKQAITKLRLQPDYVLVDAVALEGVSPLEVIVRGDQQSASIAAASIVAKVVRDRLMTEWDRTYPGYGFVRNKGYGTPEHLNALTQLGPSPIHRLSFKPVRAAAQKGVGDNEQQDIGRTG